MWGNGTVAHFRSGETDIKFFILLDAQPIVSPVSACISLIKPIKLSPLLTWLCLLNISYLIIFLITHLPSPPIQSYLKVYLNLQLGTVYDKIIRCDKADS